VAAAAPLVIKRLQRLLHLQTRGVLPVDGDCCGQVAPADGNGKGSEADNNEGEARATRAITEAQGRMETMDTTIN
jgi:hypothetical protein